jgi:dimethylaniline monooxygenase (N-oxide forming)
MEVCIIGAGFVGLLAAKSCLSHNLSPFILNKQPSFGGIWRSFPGQTGIYDSLHTNTCKYVFCFSDMPWPADAPAYPSGGEVVSYLAAYVSKHSLAQYMHHNCEVVFVDKIGDEYLVRWTCFDEVREKMFKAVVVASGKYSRERNPLKSAEKYRGEILRAGIYREPSVFDGKNVVVIGNSFSGSDLAAEAGKRAESVKHVYRREMNLMRRFVREIPYHFFIAPLINNDKPHFIPTLEQWEKDYLAGIELFGDLSQFQSCCRFDEHSLKNYFPKFVIYSEDYLDALREGKIEITKGNAKEFYENGVILEDGTRIEADFVVLAAGYKWEHPFLSDEIKRILKNDPAQRLCQNVLYRSILHPDLPRMCFLSAVDGVQPGEHELPAEIGIRYISGELNVSREEMEEGLRIEEEIRKLGFKGLADHYHLMGYTYECMRILGIELDMEFIRNELEFEKGPILGCFLAKMTDEQKEVCRRVVAEIKHKYPNLSFS